MKETSNTAEILLFIGYFYYAYFSFCPVLFSYIVTFSVVAPDVPQMFLSGWWRFSRDGGDDKTKVGRPTFAGVLVEPPRPQAAEAAEGPPGASWILETCLKMS